jgi:DNA-binding transcriptional ArsR family regulator
MASNDSEIQQKPPTIHEMLKFSTRFDIWGLLSVYHELSLSELSIKMNKSKSTIHGHMQKLIEAGIVVQKVADEYEDSNKNLKKVVYRLAENLEENDSECCKLTPEQKYSLPKIQDRLQAMQTFTEYQILLAQNWLNYIKSLKDNLTELSSKAVIDSCKSIDEPICPLTTISFYSAEQAKKFREKLLEVYFEIENEQAEKNRKNPSPRPYFGGISLWPIKSAIDSRSSKEHENESNSE